ncbi:hypothetical protein ACIBBD_23410 [Streptomyces sp. NPDC051315]|uniref:hypothetical protein n=1 Tax=Streptomyces sp. NPDC051315 TaxID=3365650 RepID=UPI0037AC0BAC
MTATHGTPAPVLRVRNTGEELLELVLEPYGSDHWLRPGETFVIWATGPQDDGLFEVEHQPGSVTVIAAASAYVGDADGNEIDCGHNRPQWARPYWLDLARPSTRDPRAPRG